MSKKQFVIPSNIRRYIGLSNYTLKATITNSIAIYAEQSGKFTVELKLAKTIAYRKFPNGLNNRIA
jgi:bifunctional DNA-binding transcriptional regulator/antitoxin component of YhaV-PrlF toxin-antitoxin module